MRHEFRRLIVSCHSAEHRMTSAELAERRPSFIIELLRQLALNNIEAHNNQLTADGKSNNDACCDENGEVMAYSDLFFNQFQIHNRQQQEQ